MRRNGHEEETVLELTWDELRDYICFDLKPGDILVVEIADSEEEDDE